MEVSLIKLDSRVFQSCESAPGVRILLEVTHRLMMLEALQKGLITGGQPARKLKMRKLGLTAIATADADFKNVPALRVY